MDKSKYIEVLQELISNLESEIRITNETDDMDEKQCKESLQYVLECSGVNVDTSDIAFE